MLLKEGFADLDTPTGPMRTHVFQPATAGRYPGVVLFSEIYQVTGPIQRMARRLVHGRSISIGDLPDAGDRADTISRKISARIDGDHARYRACSRRIDIVDARMGVG